MNSHHMAYPHGEVGLGHLSEAPKRQLHPSQPQPHHHGLSPGAIPMVMNQMPGFMPYGHQVQRYAQPMYPPMQHPRLMRHPSVGGPRQMPIHTAQHPMASQQSGTPHPRGPQHHGAVCMPHPTQQLPMHPNHPNPQQLQAHNLSPHQLLDGSVRIQFIPAPHPQQQHNMRMMERHSIPHQQLPGQQMIRPPVVASDAPLDLSAKPKAASKPQPAITKAEIKPIAQAAIITDQPLDLSKPLKVKHITTDKQPTLLSKPSNARDGQQTSHFSTPPNDDAGAPSRLPATVGPGYDDMDAYSSNSAGSLNSISSLIGNHPPDDILYLHCIRCQSSSGSINAFRKHFRNSHGYMPTREDVSIQGIKATKEFVSLKKNEYPMVGYGPVPASIGPATAPRRHCTYCGWQCDQTNPAVFSKHMKEHYDVKGCFYRCTYCQKEFHDPNTLREHVVQHVIYQHICSYCCIAYAVEEQLASHMLTHHNIRYPRKANLPVSVVLPSQSAAAPPPPTSQGVSPKIPNQGLPNLKPRDMEPAYYTKMPQDKLSGHGSPRHPGMIGYGPPNVQISKQQMMPSPRGLELRKSSSPSASYRRLSAASPRSTASTGSIAAGGDGIKELSNNEMLIPGSHAQSQINLSQLLSRAVEQGLKTTDGGYPAQSGNPSRRSSYPSTLNGCDNGAASRLASYNTSAHPHPSHPVMVPAMHSPGSGLMDLSRRSHSTTNHTAHQMRTLPAHHSPAFPEFSRTKPATSTSTLPDTIDLSKHRNVTSSIPLHYTVVCSGPQPSALAPYQALAHRHHGDIPAIPAHCTYPPNPAPVRHAIPVAESSQRILPKAPPSCTAPSRSVTSVGTARHTVSNTSATSVSKVIHPASDKCEATSVTRPKVVSKVEPGAAVDFRIKKDTSCSTTSIPQTEEDNSQQKLKRENSAEYDQQVKEELATPPTTGKPKVEETETITGSANKAEVGVDNSADVVSVNTESVAPEVRGTPPPLQTCESPLNFTVNTSTSSDTINGGDVISDIIDRVVKSRLGVAEKDSSSVSGEDNKNELNNDNMTESGSCVSADATDLHSNNGIAINVSWASNKEVEPSAVEVDPLQALTACRVLVNPISDTSGLFLSSGTQDSGSEIGRPVTRKRHIESMGKGDSGALDMSVSASQDQSEDSACSSPKRLKIAEAD